MIRAAGFEPAPLAIRQSTVSDIVILLAPSDQSSREAGVTPPGLSLLLLGRLESHRDQQGSYQYQEGQLEVIAPSRRHPGISKVQLDVIAPFFDLRCSKISSKLSQIVGHASKRFN